MKINSKSVFLCTVHEGIIKEFLERENEPLYRGKQILDWIYSKRVIKTEDMKNIPKELRQKIEENFICGSSVIEKEHVSSDGTVKFLIKLMDGETIESVIIPSPERYTFCLSTQVGCPVQCHFCASGKNGLTRNLQAGEIVEEFFHCCSKIQKLPDNLVFMGIGEGLMNFQNLSRAIEIITEDIGLSCRRITVSTSGFPPGIRKLADMGKQVNLAISLHAADEETRAKLIPEKSRYRIKDILDAGRYFREQTGRILTFEYILIKDINDSQDDCVRLAHLARECGAKVNLIPYNETGNRKFTRPSKEVIKNFESRLLQNGIKVTTRVEKGSDSNAACGQLRASSKE